MSDAKALRVAVLGYGRNGSTMHADAIAECSRFDMACVCDIDVARRSQAEARFACRTYADYREMLAEEADELDLISIVTMSHQHCEMACDCLAAGINVLVTKPWALNEAEALRMVAAQRASGHLLMPWLPSRFSPPLRRLRELVDTGILGRVFSVNRTVTTFDSRDDWQTQRRYGGGYLLNWGAHIVDTALVLGNSPVVSVYGRMMQVMNPGDTEDVFVALMTLASGTIVTAEFTVSALPRPDWIVQGTLGTAEVYADRFTVTSGNPTLSLDPTQPPPQAAIAGGRGARTWQETVPGGEWGDSTAIYGAVARAVAGEGSYAVSVDDALGFTRVLDAIRQSSETGAVVTLPHPQPYGPSAGGEATK